jgi:hypothetical protein
MLASTYILASDDGSGIGGIVVVVIGLTFWAIAQISARLNKPKNLPKMSPPKGNPQTAAARRQPVRSVATQNKYPAAIVQSAQAMQRAQVQRAQAMARKPAPARQMVSPFAAAAVRRPIPPPLRAPAPAPRAVVPAPAPAPAMPDRMATVQRREPPASVAAAMVLGLRADTLRQQIILAEILQPPVGMR